MILTQGGKLNVFAYVSAMKKCNGNSVRNRSYSSLNLAQFGGGGGGSRAPGLQPPFGGRGTAARKLLRFPQKRKKNTRENLKTVKKSSDLS